MQLKTTWLMIGGYFSGLLAGWSCGMTFTHPHWMPRSLNFVLGFIPLVTMCLLGVLSGREDARRYRRNAFRLSDR